MQVAPKGEIFPCSLLPRRVDVDGWEGERGRDGYHNSQKRSKRDIGACPYKNSLLFLCIEWNGCGCDCPPTVA
jgi:hypothetical protein